MVSEMAGTGAAVSRITTNTGDCLEVGGRGAAASGIITNTLDCDHFHGFGCGRDAPESSEMQRAVFIFMLLEGGWRGAALQNQSKYMGLP